MNVTKPECLNGALYRVETHLPTGKKVTLFGDRETAEREVKRLQTRHAGADIFLREVSNFTTRKARPGDSKSTFAKFLNGGKP